MIGPGGLGGTCRCQMMLYDPHGLDRQELVRLAKARSPISGFDARPQSGAHARTHALTCTHIAIGVSMPRRVIGAARAPASGLPPPPPGAHRECEFRVFERGVRVESQGRAEGSRVEA